MLQLIVKSLPALSPLCQVGTVPMVALSPAPKRTGVGGMQNLCSSSQQGFPWPFLLHFLPSFPHLKSTRIPHAKTVTLMATLHHCTGKTVKREAPYGSTECNCKIKTQMAVHLQRRLRLYCCTGSSKTENLQLVCVWEKMHDSCKAQFWLEILIHLRGRDKEKRIDSFFLCG